VNRGQSETPAGRRVRRPGNLAGLAGWADGAAGLPEDIRHAAIPDDLTRHNCLTYANTGQQYDWHFLRRGHRHKVTVAGNLNGNNGDILCAAAADGLGVVLQPTFLLYELLRTKQLVRILESYEPKDSRFFRCIPAASS
jgi:DNA-binding transcriptional LysR family regulator